MNIIKKAIFAVVLSMAALVCWAVPASAQGSQKGRHRVRAVGAPDCRRHRDACARPRRPAFRARRWRRIYTDATLTVAGAQSVPGRWHRELSFLCASRTVRGAVQRAADSDGDHLSRRDSSRGCFVFRRREQHLGVWVDPRRKFDGAGNATITGTLSSTGFQSRNFDAHDARSIGKRIGGGAAAARGRDRFRRERRWRDRRHGGDSGGDHRRCAIEL